VELRVKEESIMVASALAQRRVYVLVCLRAHV
jgi:hypothetical protein